MALWQKSDLPLPRCVDHAWPMAKPWYPRERPLETGRVGHRPFDGEYYWDGGYMGNPALFADQSDKSALCPLFPRKQRYELAQVTFGSRVGWKQKVRLGIFT